MPTRCSERGGAWIALLAAAALAGAINGYLFLLAAVIVRILTVTESRRPCEVAPLEVFGVIADPARLPALIARELGHFRAPDQPFPGPGVQAMRPPLYTCQGVRSLPRNFIDLARLRSLMVINGKAWVLKRAAGSIRQRGEFGADRAALAVA